MKNIIINGDSIVEMNKMKANSVDLIFADPPYWMRTEGVLQRTEGTDFDGCDDEWDKFNSLQDYEQFTKQWLTQCHRILKPNGSIWVIGGMQCIYTIGAIMQQIGYWFINDVIWQKKNPTPNFRGTRLNNSHETLIWATKNKNSKITFHYKTAKELNIDSVSESEFKDGVRKQMGSVWKFSVCSGNERLKNDKGEKLHNAQKPQALLERIMSISSNLGDLVLDPFGGTMTTAAAAKKLGRNYIMIEKEEQYCKYGAQRLDNIIFENTPITHAEFDRKPQKVTVTEMIENAYFIEGEGFYFKDGTYIASLRSDGKLLYKNQIIDMHSCAALARKTKAKRLNGFDYWYVIRDKKLVSISDIREQYRADLKK